MWHASLQLEGWDNNVVLRFWFGFWCASMLDTYVSFLSHVFLELKVAAMAVSNQRFIGFRASFDWATTVSIQALT